MDALTYKNNPNLLKTYVRINGIKGLFLTKDDKGWVPFEGTSDYIGLPTKTFRTKREAVAYIDEWCSVTGLPRFDNFNC